MVLLILVVVLVGIVGYLVMRKPATELINQPTQSSNNQAPALSAETQPSNKTPLAEKGVTSQPAYLIAAYLKDGKNYIDVDYVEWLYGDASIKAQVEDGKCASVSECYAFPNGYKRNLNPLIRTFEVSFSAPINVNGTIAFAFNALGQNLSISFKQLKDTVSKMKSYLSYDPPFKEPKTFITIDVNNNIVTKIVEPYQE